MKRMDRFVKLRNVSLESRKKAYRGKEMRTEKSRVWRNCSYSGLLGSLTSDNRRTSNARVLRENVNFSEN